MSVISRVQHARNSSSALLIFQLDLPHDYPRLLEKRARHLSHWVVRVVHHFAQAGVYDELGAEKAGRESGVYGRVLY